MRLLTETENVKAHAFASAHYVNRCRHPWLRWRRNKKQAVQIDAVQTGIGFVVTAACPYCGERADITDYESW